jgi:Spy/CpxP family protein refolding chaperone
MPDGFPWLSLPAGAVRNVMCLFNFRGRIATRSPLLGGAYLSHASIRTLLVALTLLSSHSALTGAQQAPPPKPSQAPATKAPRDVDSPETDESLNLSQDQKDKIKAIRDDAQQQLLDVQKDTTLSDEAKQARIKKIRKTERAQVFGVLTPEQQKTWAAEQRERREARKQAAPQH